MGLIVRMVVQLQLGGRGPGPLGRWLLFRLDLGGQPRRHGTAVGPPFPQPGVPLCLPLWRRHDQPVCCSSPLSSIPFFGPGMCGLCLLGFAWMDLDGRGCGSPRVGLGRGKVGRTHAAAAFTALPVVHSCALGLAVWPVCVVRRLMCGIKALVGDATIRGC